MAAAFGAVFALLVLGGCGDVQLHGFAGRLIDQPSPPVTVVEGGPSGALLGGSYITDVPDTAVDRIVGAGLGQWLTFEEKRSLAVASERAATAPVDVAVGWQAHDGGNEVTASGNVAAVGEVFRSVGGEICRNVRQSMEKNAAPHAANVTLCREPVAQGVVLWVASAG